MEQKYIDVAEKFGINLNTSRTESLGSIAISSGKIRISDCMTEIDDATCGKTVEVKPGEWKGNAFTGFFDWYFSDFVDRFIKVKAKQAEVVKPYDDALNALSDIKDSASSEFIKEMLLEQKRKKTSNEAIIDEYFFGESDPEEKLKDYSFTKMAGVVIAHKDFAEHEAFSKRNIEGLNLEFIGQVSLNNSAIGLFDFDFFKAQSEDILSDIYYGGSSIDPDLLNHLGQKRDYAAQAVENSGFVSSTGFGGGDNDVYALKDEEGKVVLIHIMF